MPIYEYKCEECGHTIELLQNTVDEKRKDCPKCGARMKRLLGVPALIFKGSGFYATDYAQGSTGSGRPSQSSKPGSEKVDADESASSDTSDKKAEETGG